MTAQDGLSHQGERPSSRTMAKPIIGPSSRWRRRAGIFADYGLRIAAVTRDYGHHPNISFGWGNATISLQTKKIKGLHENDFIMATKIDRIFARTFTA
jgi:4a-hydroxytetrahydrobiopterin dehydratase